MKLGKQSFVTSTVLSSLVACSGAGPSWGASTARRHPLSVVEGALVRPPFPQNRLVPPRTRKPSSSAQLVQLRSLWRSPPVAPRGLAREPWQPRIRQQSLEGARALESVLSMPGCIHRVRTYLARSYIWMESHTLKPSLRFILTYRVVIHDGSTVGNSSSLAGRHPVFLQLLITPSQMLYLLL